MPATDEKYIKNLLDRVYWEGFNQGGDYVRKGKPLTEEQVNARNKFLASAQRRLSKRFAR